MTRGSMPCGVGGRWGRTGEVARLVRLPLTSPDPFGAWDKREEVVGNSTQDLTCYHPIKMDVMKS